MSCIESWAVSILASPRNFHTFSLSSSSAAPNERSCCHFSLLHLTHMILTQPSGGPQLYGIVFSCREPLALF